MGPFLAINKVVLGLQPRSCLADLEATQACFWSVLCEGEIALLERSEMVATVEDCLWNTYEEHKANVFWSVQSFLEGGDL